MPGISDPALYRDKSVTDHFPVFHHYRKARALSEFSEEIIEEHRQNPLGRKPNYHSLKLRFLLGYFRTISAEAIYVPILLPQGGQWGILASGRGKAPAVIEGERYNSADEARHAIFLRRLSELGVAREGKARV